jgi:uncharacterized protein YndB with AHSA1/START domain
MKADFTAKASIEIGASAAKVWDALTNPALIKQYLFGTDAVSDWKVGSPITYKGVWGGKPYEDKGRIVETVPHKLLKTTYWSSFSSRPDLPENYSNVTYTLSGKNGRTLLEVEQDNNPTKESAEHSRNNWKTVLQTMKTVLEK